MSSRVMIVEDEAIVAMDLENRLESLGYSVVGAAHHGQEAVDMAPAWNPEVVLMDINLGGGMDGIFAASKIRETLDVPIIFVTAYSDDATITRAKLTEPYGYLIKPFNERDLRSTIEIALYKHKSERKLKSVERWLATTLNCVGDGVLSVDESGAVSFMNPEAESITGWTVQEVRGRHYSVVFGLIDEKTGEDAESPIENALREGLVLQLGTGTLLRRKNGMTVPIDDTAAPIRNDRGEVIGAVIIFRDISQRKLDDDEKRRIEQKQHQAQNLETLGRLAGGIANDFNNLMSVILGQVEMLATRVRDPLVMHGLDTIGRATERATSLTRQLLAFGRRQVLQPSDVDLNEIVERMEWTLRRLLGDKVAISTFLQRGLPPTKVDPSQVEQIILNLALNARDAMGVGGRLIFETSVQTLDEAYASQHLDLHPGPYLLLRVADTGCGMDAKTKEHIFEPFFTTKTQDTGMGLGLATVYGIVKQSGGHIEVLSELGHGSTFKVYLPQATGLPIESEALPRQRIPSDLMRRETILIVDDEDMMRDITQEMLDSAGFAVLKAADGDAARKLIKQYGEAIALLLTDVAMPREDGPALAKALVAIQPKLKVLFMSGYTNTAIPGQDGLGARLISKPFHLHDLVRTVREVLDS